VVIFAVAVVVAAGEPFRAWPDEGFEYKRVDQPFLFLTVFGSYAHGGIPAPYLCPGLEDAASR
jgi:hypothetical protein